LQRCRFRKLRTAALAGDRQESGDDASIGVQHLLDRRRRACHDLPPMPLREGTTVIGCLMASQVEGAKWVAAHPNQYIRKITCEPAGRFAKI